MAGGSAGTPLFEVPEDGTDVNGTVEPVFSGDLAFSAGFS
jgi:hypothetical protein